MHYSLIVIGEDFKSQLEPFDCNMDCDLHVVMTKSEIITQEREKLIYEQTKGPYSAYLRDPSNLTDHAKRVMNKLNMTDEELYQDYIKNYYEEDDIDPDTGNILGTYNENGKWDWYEVGGRWSGKLKIKFDCTDYKIGCIGDDEIKLVAERRADQAKVKDIMNLKEITCYAFLKDGQWYEEEDEYNFFTDTEEQIKSGKLSWNEKVTKMLQGLDPEEIITCIDYHC